MQSLTQINIPIPARPWTGTAPPKKILAIRLQAMGDTMITLPYLQYLRNNLPADTRIDFLTREETRDIPDNIHLFDKVYALGGGRSFKRQMALALLLLPRLLLQRYELVIDLQNNTISRIIRKALAPAAWSAFDRYSPIPAGERNRLTIEAAGLGKNEMDTRFRLKAHYEAAAVLRNKGWKEGSPLIVLNPAGAFPTRNWELLNYVYFAELCLQQWPDCTFLVAGTSFIREKAAILKSALGDRLIDLTSQTTPSGIFAILQQATLVLSEDSGLLHMAWISGIPNIALFGSTRSDWSRPLGPHSLFLDSSDLPCGNCMESRCRYGDVYCLNRISPEQVFTLALFLLQK